MGTDFNYDDTSHQVIFDHINGGAGSDALQETSRGWQRLGDGVGTTCKSYVQSAIGVILTARQGEAAQAAAAATGAMLPWMDTVLRTTATVAQRAQDQAEYGVTAKNNVPPVPPAPQSARFFGDPTEGVPASAASRTANTAANTSSTTTRTRSSVTCHPPRRR